MRQKRSIVHRTIYFERDFIAQCKEIANWHEVQVTVASPLLKELVLGLFDPENSEDAHLLMALLLLQTLCKEKSLATNLPMPKDERLRRAVTQLIATNGWHLSSWMLHRWRRCRNAALPDISALTSA